MFIRIRVRATRYIYRRADLNRYVLFSVMFFFLSLLFIISDFWLFNFYCC